ncbi:PREDICTED: uncharacterized protein LOC108361232 [Rhagoletis zephyria]|uniref:uncharacterized protein LOC108361232 n=1 Tax=Rhagoletis zephyria TaxID=28612 RepID=UPI0008112EFC|nr:PREDICTED: uncharacterized protein LOC108361232 [Rhagoletis zephyria]
MATTKSGQSAKRLSELSQLYNSLKFLEPTLNSAASTTSNLMDPTDIMYEVEFLETDDLESTPSTSKTTPTPSAKRRRMEKEDADFAKTVESALQTITSASKTDKWDDLGAFVSSSGRELDIENPLLAKEFKVAVQEVILNFQKIAVSNTSVFSEDLT